ncbi:glutaminyl-peptide cyclotransferase [Corynebacterium guangdongense]|uniref:Glutamine cyclotransferase n=1 Tax=Corynebacterium guangdongense TaxID=1783348 RepID=A0ABU1ZWN3_9CORY|nr:glutaminyl-peptide cyclotransferase [Corynebacterium guangdongense]MDR7328783.1 glutamine cyclotransferase [Corynebacterium guangdongense]WJZ17358.1 Glutamine cyclotransferase [Corynebacterium guangdongense]
MASRIPVLLMVPLAASALAACAGSSSAALSSDPGPETTDVERLGVEIVDTHPFDESSFTQGLEVEPEGTLLVGTGQWGESRVYRRTLDGREVLSRDIDGEHFGEGVTRHRDTVWQLTWQSGVAYRRDADTLEEVGRVRYPGEGWGLCSFQDELLMSDGTSQLRRLEPATFREVERVSVTLDGAPVTGLNELECVNGPEGPEVYANVFTDTDILRIDAATGRTTGVIDGSTIPNNAAPDPDNVLNGIAAIPGSDHFYLSGKRWPDLYEVRFVPVS